MKKIGTGQGSGGSPHFRLAISKVLSRCVDIKLYEIMVQKLTGTIQCECNEDAFVDDSGLIVDDRKGDVLERPIHNSQNHERYLHVSGGLVLEIFFNIDPVSLK